MQIDQFVRRAVWRLKRRVRPGADNDPIVSLESEPPPPRRRRSLRATFIAFAATLSLLAGGYAWLIAAGSRAPLDASAMPVSGASAAAALFAMDLDASPAVADEWLFVPSGKPLRLAQIRAGAQAAAAAYVAQAAGPAPSQAPLRDALAAARNGDAAGARDGLLQYESRRLRDAASSAILLRALATDAAEACAAEEQELRAAMRDDRGGMAGPAAQARYSHARGVAYGWLMVLRGVLAERPADDALAPVATAALDPLAAAAESAPLILFNGSDASPWAPAHLELLADDLAAAAAGARALGDAAGAL